MTPYHCLTIYYYYYSCYTFMKGSAKTFGCENNTFPFKFAIIVVRNSWILQNRVYLDWGTVLQFFNTAVPLQAWSGPEGSRKLRFPDFTTTAQDGDKVVSLTHRPPLRAGNTPGTHCC